MKFKNLKTAKFRTGHSNKIIEQYILEDGDDIHDFVQEMTILKNNPFGLIDKFNEIVLKGNTVLCSDEHPLSGYPTWRIECKDKESKRPDAWIRVNDYYGKKPIDIGFIDVNVNEMMFYQDMLISDKGESGFMAERRLTPFFELISFALSDFENRFGYERLKNSYIYTSVKHLWQNEGKSFNRSGWHSDGFGTNDINYIWSSDGATVFNDSLFNVRDDDKLSILDFNSQAKPENDFTLPEKHLVMLDQFNIHKVGDVKKSGLRTFVKVSFSNDRYCLNGNALNPYYDYKDWEFKPRSNERNIPQHKIK